jgi:hypothetical protein
LGGIERGRQVIQGVGKGKYYSRRA